MEIFQQLRKDIQMQVVQHPKVKIKEPPDGFSLLEVALYHGLQETNIYYIFYIES